MDISPTGSARNTTTTGSLLNENRLHSLLSSMASSRGSTELSLSSVKAQPSSPYSSKHSSWTKQRSCQAARQAYNERSLFRLLSPPDPRIHLLPPSQFNTCGWHTDVSHPDWLPSWAIPSLAVLQAAGFYEAREEGFY